MWAHLKSWSPITVHSGKQREKLKWRKTLWLAHVEVKWYGKWSEKYERHLRKGLLPKEHLSKPIDPNCLKPETDRRTADCPQVFSDCLCLLKALLVFCPSHKLGISKQSIISPKGEGTWHYLKWRRGEPERITSEELKARCLQMTLTVGLLHSMDVIYSNAARGMITWGFRGV